MNTRPVPRNHSEQQQHGLDLPQRKWEALSLARALFSRTFSCASYSNTSIQLFTWVEVECVPERQAQPEAAAAAAVVVAVPQLLALLLLGAPGQQVNG